MFSVIHQLDASEMYRNGITSIRSIEHSASTYSPLLGSASQTCHTRLELPVQRPHNTSNTSNRCVQADVRAPERTTATAAAAAQRETSAPVLALDLTRDHTPPLHRIAFKLTQKVPAQFNFIQIQAHPAAPVLAVSILALWRQCCCFHGASVESSRRQRWLV